MTPEQKAYYAMRIEAAKDNTPSTSVFVWFIPLFIVCALLGRTETPHHDARSFSLQDSAFICVMGQCL